MPVSAQECAASATMDAEPVSAAAQVLATATRKFAPNAISTVMVLSDPADSVGADEPNVTIGAAGFACAGSSAPGGVCCVIGLTLLRPDGGTPGGSRDGRPAAAS